MEKFDFVVKVIGGDISSVEPGVAEKLQG
jgi:hypothetical protein